MKMRSEKQFIPRELWKDTLAKMSAYRMRRLQPVWRAPCVGMHMLLFQTFITIICSTLEASCDELSGDTFPFRAHRTQRIVYGNTELPISSVYTWWGCGKWNASEIIWKICLQTFINPVMPDRFWIRNFFFFFSFSLCNYISVHPRVKKMKKKEV